jgi:putative oxidoreductase
MKKMSASKQQNLLDITALILRVLVAALMLTHGLPKLSKLLAGGEIKFPDPLGVGSAFSLGLTVFAEVFCSILIGIGLFTRWATVPLIITMLVAVLIVHAGDPFKDKEEALLYFAIYVAILFIGSGKYAIDYLFKKK